MPEAGRGISDYRASSYLERLVDPRKSDDYMLGRLKEYVESGRTLLRSQAAWKDNELALDILGENRLPQLAKGQSSVSINRCRREFREMVASSCNLRPTENCVTLNPEWEASVYKLNKRCKAWWTATFADRKYRQACQYAFGLGTGYLSPWWDNNFWGHNSGEINVKIYGPSGVLPVMMTEDFDLQKAYAVTMVEETPLHIVAASFPAFSERLTANRKVPGWMSRQIERARKKATDLWGVLNSPMESVGGEMPTVDVYYTYILDKSVNNSGRVVPMGKPGTSWYYEVPYIGQEIPSGIRDIQGKELLAKAAPEDCLLFPIRRLCIWTDTVVLQDDTSPYLHGKVPVVQLRFDDSPWDFLGFSIIHDTWRIQKSRNRITRIMEDSFYTRMNPPLGWDENSNLTEAAVARLTAGGMAGKTLKMNFSLGEALKPILDPKHWDVPAWGVELLKWLGEEQENQAITKDLTALAKAKQIPSADSIEKLLESAGQVPQDMARGGEKAIAEFAALWFPLEIQFGSAKNMMRVLGDEGITKEALDYKPGSMIPSHLPGEDDKRPSRFQDWERLRFVMEQLSIQIEPYSQAQVSKIGRGLQLLQLIKAGLPIDPWTVARVFSLDMGPEPAGCSNMVQRWVAWNKLRAELQAEIQEEAQGGQQPQQGENRGRPATNQRSPQIKNKDQGARSTVATSR